MNNNTNLETVLTCPLGATCEEIKDNKIHRCLWYVTVQGSETDSKTGEVVSKDKTACAMEWMPILQIEMSKTNRGQTTALESFRNETVKRQDDMINEVKTNNKINILKTLENSSQDIKQIKTIDSDIISE
jgi:hypothetical protein